VTAPNIYRIFLAFLPFWIFLILFKFGAGLHYSVVAPLGEKLLPLWVVGTLMGGCALAQLILDVPVGHLLDRYGYRKLLTLGTILFVLAAGILVLEFSLTTYLISLGISIFGWVFFGPGVNAYILSHAPKAHAGKFISFRDVFGSLGVVLISAVLGIALLLSPQFIALWMVCALLLALVAIRLSPKDHTSVHVEKKHPQHHYFVRRKFLPDTFKALAKLNPASGMLLLLGFSSSVFYGIIWFVVPIVIVHQADAGLLSLGLGIFDFAVVVLGFFLGSLADRWNKRTLVFFGILLFSVSGLFLGFHFSWLFLLFGFLATTGEEMASITLWSWLHSLDKEHDSDGLVSGIINVFQDLGWAVGPFIAGIAYTLIGPSWTIAIGAGFILVTWIAYQFVIREHKHPVAVRVRSSHRPRHKS